ncbi:MAG: DUF3108 domain-containing protein [Deltaproteobacteria bacterium]|nr:DUF3108 domain-containing protein [Deltaproteobacteria bacterium]
MKIHSLFITLSISVVLFLGAHPSWAKDRCEILRYDVIWNGAKAGHGDITMRREANKMSVTVQAVSDGALKAILELWSRVQATFSAKTFQPETYSFHLKSNLLRSEVVDLSFDAKKQTVHVNKRNGDETESHSEKVSGLRDPISAVYLLRSSKDWAKPLSVDIYDGKDKSRLFVYPVGPEIINIKAGSLPAIRMDLRLDRLGRESREIAKGKLWISNDENRIPLLLTSSPIVGSIRFELVQAQM